MLSLYVALLLAAPPAEKAKPPVRGDLAPPVKLLVGGKPIDVDIGHAAPCVADLKGDGTLTLLVGQFGDGKVRVYRNTGSKTEPRFDKFEWLQAGGGDCKVPTG
jgi:hypothetical protein